MSFTNQVLKLAYQSGYRIIKGRIISPKGKELKGRITKKGYGEFSYRLPVSFKPGIRLTKPVKIHKLVAFQKYGDINNLAAHVRGPFAPESVKICLRQWVILFCISALLAKGYDHRRWPFPRRS